MLCLGSCLSLGNQVFRLGSVRFLSGPRHLDLTKYLKFFGSVQIDFFRFIIKISVKYL